MRHSIHTLSPSARSHRSPDAPSSERLVHFAGSWTPTDVRLVSRCIEQLESDATHGLPARSLGEPWVCTCHPIHNGSLFSAHRAGLHCTISGRSARELVLRIQTHFHVDTAPSPSPARPTGGAGDAASGKAGCRVHNFSPDADRLPPVRA